MSVACRDFVVGLLLCSVYLSNVYHYTVCYNGSNEHTLKSYNQRGAVPLDDEQKEALTSLVI